MSKYLLLGKNGLLGNSIMNSHLFEDCVGLSHDELDVCNFEEMRKIILDIKPQNIINCTAYTDVTGAEKNQDLAFATNGYALGNLSQICKMNDIKLIHFSTDYVFQGIAPAGYSEESEVKPVNIYGESKLCGENLIKECNCNYLIIRISWLFGEGGRNFVSTISKLLRERKYVKIVSDQLGKVTYTEDLVQALYTLLKVNTKGVVHFANTGSCSRYEFTKEIKKMLDEKLGCEIFPQKAIEYPDPTPRPVISLLKTKKYEDLTGNKISDWKTALKRYIEKCKNS